MEITKTADVSIKALFQVVTESLKRDYQENTLKKLKKEDIIPGLNYIKTFGSSKQNQIKVIVERFEIPNQYDVSFCSNRGKQTISYHFQELEANKTLITYVQNLQASDIFQKGNHFLMNTLFKKSIEKQTQAQLEALVMHAKSLDISEKERQS
ncbi:DUF3284 domain-containing protein [Streptococcus thoraltensis]|uniref:DUF3284 domain-containing protein n=1 Tax=Streptococcus thoraltensis TaxID=55085 RepID=UPI001F5A815D|nr:DUF3284 domain-containing protein [Streptococcus thoraltensis]